MNESILITGGCGFVGSNLALKLREDYPDSRIIALDNLKRRGSELNIERLKNSNVEFIHGDIRCKEDFDGIKDITVIIDAAAEPSVLSGISSTPDYVINSNLLGTINSLNLALKNAAKFIFISTSRVYPITSLNNIRINEAETRFEISDKQVQPGISIKGINELFPMDGSRSFYGTSKLASEMIIQEYCEFYGLKAIINRCGVISGPWQMGKIDQGIMVLWLSRHYWRKELSYIGFGGKGKQVRDIIHIRDLYRLIRTQLNDFDKFSREIFNVGGGYNISISLQELTKLCEEITGKRIRIQHINENRIADIPVYITDNSKISSLSGWEPEISIREILTDIFAWLNSNENKLKNILN